MRADMINKKSVPLQVVDVIKASLKSGELHVGDKLPSESELADMMGVSHSSIREGIKILVAYGMLEVRQGDGTFVVDKFVENMFDFLGLNPQTDHYKSLIEMRQVLECGAAYLLSGKLSEEECCTLQDLAKAIKPENTLEENIYYDNLFHTTLIGYTKNDYLIEFYKMIKQMSVSLMELLMCHEDVLADAMAAHGRIADALRNGTTTEAWTETSRHISTIMKYASLYVHEEKS